MSALPFDAEEVALLTRQAQAILAEAAEGGGGDVAAMLSAVVVVHAAADLRWAATLEDARQRIEALTRHLELERAGWSESLTQATDHLEAVRGRVAEAARHLSIILDPLKKDGDS